MNMEFLSARELAAGDSRAGQPPPWRSRRPTGKPCRGAMNDRERFPNLQVLDHPLIQHKLSLMRNRETPTNQFRQLMKEVALLLGYEVTRGFPLTTRKIQTPLTEMDAPILGGRKPVIVPILRAGTGMAEGLLELMPSARVGSIGLYRDEATKRPVEYLVKLPDVASRVFIVTDPMLATGNSAAHAVGVLTERGVPAERIMVLALVVAPEGMEVFQQRHPQVTVFCASLDSHLDGNAFIVPGLGDAGDRLYGTK